MNPARNYKIALSLLIVVLIGLSGFMQRDLNRDRADFGLTRITPLENAPPLLAFTTVALGGFRGLIANMLWVRANEMQINDKYFEMVQLSDWITKLQPHFTPVWQYMAWNMAYNISIKFPDPNDRWHWVNSGITLLRDEGLRYNPHETLLYFELANILQHKVGGDQDDAQMHFKYMWAWQFDTVLGARPNLDDFIDPKTDDMRERARVLREVYKMDPAVMKEIDMRYGPMEWRLPETHAIYWAVLGLRDATAEEKVRLRRMVFHSMQLAVRRGKMIENRADKRLEFAPNIEMIPNANASYVQMMEEDPEWAASMVNGHMNFLKKAVSDLWVYNRRAEAESWFEYLKQKYPEAVYGNPPLQEYVRARINEELTSLSPAKAVILIEGFISQAYYSLALGEDENFIGTMGMAQMIWKQHYDNISQHQMADIEDRLRIAHFPNMQVIVLRRMLDPANGLMSPQLAAQLMTRLGIAELPPAPQNLAIAMPVPEPKLNPVDAKVPFINSGSSTNAPIKVSPATEPKGKK